MLALIVLQAVYPPQEGSVCVRERDGRQTRSKARRRAVALPGVSRGLPQTASHYVFVALRIQSTIRGLESVRRATLGAICRSLGQAGRLAGARGALAQKEPSLRLHVSALRLDTACAGQEEERHIWRASLSHTRGDIAGQGSLRSPRVQNVCSVASDEADAPLLAARSRREGQAFHRNGSMGRRDVSQIARRSSEEGKAQRRSTGQVDVLYDKSASYDFFSITKDLEPPGSLFETRS